MIRMYDKYFLNNVLFFGQEDNRESLRDRSRSQVEQMAICIRWKKWGRAGSKSLRLVCAKYQA